MPIQESLPLLAEVTQLAASDRTSFVLPFTVPACTSSHLVGGKGCQLAMLTQLDSQVRLVSFNKTVYTFNIKLVYNKATPSANEI